MFKSRQQPTFQNLIFNANDSNPQLPSLKVWRDTFFLHTPLVRYWSLTIKWGLVSYPRHPRFCWRGYYPFAKNEINVFKEPTKMATEMLRRKEGANKMSSTSRCNRTKSKVMTNFREKVSTEPPKMSDMQFLEWVEYLKEVRINRAAVGH